MKQENEHNLVRKVESFKGLDIYMDEESIEQSADKLPDSNTESTQKSVVGSLSEKSIGAIKKIKL